MKKLTKRALTLLLAGAMAASLDGCSFERRSVPDQNGTFLYYLNQDESSVHRSAYTPSDATTEGALEELLTKLQEDPEETDCIAPLPEGVAIQSRTLTDGLLRLDFSSEYREMEKTREVLVRAAFVKTLLQIDGVTGVEFYIDSRPAEDAAGNVIGVMTMDTFVENAKQINAYQNAAIDLYFADESGKKLNIESRSIYYSSQKPLEWAIVERLIAGPKAEGNRAVLPPETQILSVTNSEETCYVNLSKSLLINAVDVDEQLPIYAIVNSICTNCKGIRKVQFSIEGDNDVIFRKSMSLKKTYRINQGLVNKTEEE